ncbi:MAG: hypothetical protein E6I75_19700 [Chloroflexi bacterium]|nr:MAG: hypothetical protein E6I75_19700 [Chloroflexota bacterium]
MIALVSKTAGSVASAHSAARPSIPPPTISSRLATSRPMRGHQMAANLPRSRRSVIGLPMASNSVTFAAAAAWATAV